MIELRRGKKDDGAICFFNYQRYLQQHTDPVIKSGTFDDHKFIKKPRTETADALGYIIWMSE